NSRKVWPRGRSPTPTRASATPTQATATPSSGTIRRRCGNSAAGLSVTPMPDGVPTWEQIARDHGRFLYNVAYRLAGSDADAKDLVQEALLRVRRGLETYNPGALEAWLA